MKVLLLSSTGENGSKHVFTQDRRIDITITDEEIWGEVIRRVNAHDKIVAALEAVNESGLLMGQYVIHDTTRKKVHDALEVACGL